MLITEPIVMEAIVSMDKLDFGRRLRSLRASAGLSQKAFAEAAGVPQSAVSQWEMGISVPLINKAPSIAAALGVPVESLFEINDEEPPPTRLGRPPKAQEPAREPLPIPEPPRRGRPRKDDAE